MKSAYCASLLGQFPNVRTTCIEHLSIKPSIHAAHMATTKHTSGNGKSRRAFYTVVLPRDNIGHCVWKYTSWHIFIDTRNGLGLLRYVSTPAFPDICIQADQSTQRTYQVNLQSSPAFLGKPQSHSSDVSALNC